MNHFNSLRQLVIVIALFLLPFSNTIDPSTPFKWGNFKPQLIYSLSEKDSSPITVRFAFGYPNLHVSRYDLIENDGTNVILDYNYHNGRDFSEQTIYDQDTNFQFKMISIRDTTDSPSEQWSIYAVNPQSKGFVNQMLTDIMNKFTSPRDSLFNNEGFMENDNALLMRKPSQENAVFGFSLSLEQLLENIEVDPKDYYIMSSDEGNNSFLIRNKSNHEIISILRIKFIENEALVSSKLDYKFLKNSDKFNNWRIGNELRNFLFESTPTAESQENSIDNTVLFFRIPLKLSSNFLLHILYKEDLTIPTVFEDKYDLISQKIQSRRVQYLEDFISKFPPSEGNKLDCAISSLSNLLGGLTYMEGPIKTSTSYGGYTQNKPLFTMTPCRRGFARGFLWDEGFHNMVVSQLNPKISLEIIKHWLDTTFENGWIPREQIRGPEIEQYANRDFLVQNVNEANPPTLIIPLNYIFKEFKTKGDEKGLLEIKGIWQKAKIWFDWFHNSQSSSKEYIYHWSVERNGFNLGSGMDDYPRNDHGFTSKFHLDLQVWNIVFAEHLLPLMLEFETDVEKIDEMRTIITKSKENLHKVFRDPEDFLYKDTDGLRFSQHLGYDNLFPLFFGLIDDNSKELESVLNLIRDENKLWSLAGVRSLSRSDITYRGNDNYWTSPIWINLNYMVLRGIKMFYWDNQEAKKIYQELRGNLVRNVCGKWRETGQFWETFDDVTTDGTHHRLFNGWTSLITLIISEKYI